VRRAERADVSDRERWWSEAESVYGDALTRDRGYLAHWWGRGKLRATRGLRDRTKELEEFARAESDYEEALRIAPGHPRTLELLGNVRAHRGFERLHGGRDPLPDFEQAERDLSEALQGNPGSAEAWIWRGIVRDHSGVYRAAKGLDPLPNYAAAESDFTRAIDVERDDPDAWLERGILRTNRGMSPGRSAAEAALDRDGAESDLTESLKLNPHSGETFRSRGMVRVQRGMSLEAGNFLAEARAQYQSALLDYEEASRVDAAEAQGLVKPIAELRAKCLRLGSR
jgi:tetratricopeptide (TPR) repeat protein